MVVSAGRLASAVVGALVNCLEVVSVAVTASVKERFTRTTLSAVEETWHGSATGPDLLWQRAVGLCGIEHICNSLFMPTLTEAVKDITPFPVLKR